MTWWNRLDPGIVFTSVRSPEPNVVEVIWSEASAPGYFGIRVSADELNSGEWPVLGDRPLDELAALLVSIGIEEPRPEDRWLESDVDGVRWIPLRAWAQ